MVPNSVANIEYALFEYALFSGQGRKGERGSKGDTGPVGAVVSTKCVKLIL